jgi:hypothetical protein
MRKEEQINSKPNSIFEEELEKECRDLQDILKSFRDIHHAAADRSRFFWKNQHDSIMKRIEAPRTSSKFRHPLVWAPVAIVLLVCLIFLLPEKNVPIPDIAAGYDQDLLLEVERALNRNCPVALEPIELLAREIEP